MERGRSGCSGGFRSPRKQHCQRSVPEEAISVATSLARRQKSHPDVPRWEGPGYSWLTHQGDADSEGLWLCSEHAALQIIDLGRAVTPTSTQTSPSRCSPASCIVLCLPQHVAGDEQPRKDFTAGGCTAENKPLTSLAGQFFLISLKSRTRDNSAPRALTGTHVFSHQDLRPDSQQL